MVPYMKMAEIRYEAEVVVVGGGLAGCCAALAAARRGKQVLLIEQNGCLGGLATLGHVSPLDAVKARDGTPFWRSCDPNFSTIWKKIRKPTAVIDPIIR